MKELKTSFVLKKYGKNEKLILLYGNFGYKELNVLTGKTVYKPLKYSTKVKIKLGEWDRENKVPFDYEKRSAIEEIEKKLRNIYKYFVGGEEEITPNILKEELDKKLNRTTSKNRGETMGIIAFTSYIDEIIMKGGTGRTKSTLQSYSKVHTKITDFEKEIGFSLTTKSLNEEVYLKYVEFLRKRLGRINSVWNELKNFQAVINEIKRKYKLKGVYSPSEELAKKDKVKQVSEEKIYLDFNAINRIIQYEPKTESLKNTKLILLCLVFTGCRYSDVFKINSKDEYSKNGITYGYARFSDLKQDSDIIVPILKPLKEAIRSNNNQLPHKISDVKFNKYVKDLVELVGMNEEVTLSYRDSYGKTQYETKPFYSLISSHIGRRSFITNLINFIPVTILSKITGHSLTNKNVIFSYNKISLQDNVVMFLKELQRVQKSYPKEFPIKLF